MISLQIALLIAGIVAFLIVAVISYDRMRHTRLHSRRDAGLDYAEDSPRADPLLTPHSLLDDQPLEPKLRSTRSMAEQPVPTALADDRQAEQPEPEPPSPAGANPELKPEFLEPEPADTEDSAAKAGQFEEQPEDPDEIANAPVGGVPELRDRGGEDAMQIEYVARIPGTNVIKRDSALGIYRQHEFDLHKPHRIFGLSHPTRMWCDLEKQPESARFTDLGMTLQLADRDGPADEGELNQFSQIVLKMSEVLGRRFQFSCKLDSALEQGQVLEKLIKKYDALAILNIVARNEPFTMSDVDTAAGELGMTSNQKNVYVKHENKVPLYRMANRETTGGTPPASDEADPVTRELSVFMDIPRTPDPERVFNDMIDDAKELCRRLDGKLVDDNHRGMTQKGLKRIGREIRTMSGEMERDGIAPGRESALKLF